MDFLDLIRELRKGEPDIRKAQKAMKILGWVCIVGAVWNFIFFFIAPFEDSPINLPPESPYLMLILLLFLGVLFLRSAKGIGEMESWGIKTGQIALFLLVATVIGFAYSFFPHDFVRAGGGSFRIFFLIFSVVFMAQFALPAYYGIRYLSRLPTRGKYPSTYRSSEDRPSGPDEDRERDYTGPTVSYKEALLPFGVFGTFFVLLAIPMLVVFMAVKFSRPEAMPVLFFPLFLFVFLAPVLYNGVPSSFQENREVVTSFTGGGSISLFQGSWPFFRLIVYRDGLEIRAMLHRFFIPYDSMEDIPGKVGFFTRGILIKSDLPDVPSGIRFAGFGMKRIVRVVSEARRDFLAGD